MKKIYVLVLVDLVRQGYNPKSVDVFPNVESANAQMKEQYLKKCEEEMIDTPMADDSMGYQFTKNGYAYIFGKYYWDIFEKEIDF